MSNSIQDIENYLNDGEQFKVKYPQLWTDDLEQIIIKLKEIIELSTLDKADAINEFKLADIDFLSTIQSMNEYDNIGEHIRFLEENMNTNREKIKEISDLIEQLNTAFHNI
jgi:wobble nucleotide-excising tRNase